MTTKVIVDTDSVQDEDNKTLIEPILQGAVATADPTTPLGVATKQMVDNSSGLPPGVIMAYGAMTAPAGWLICDGAAVSRTTYAALFAILGTVYGSGNGSTTFGVPDLRGRVPVGELGGTGRITNDTPDVPFSGFPINLGTAGGDEHAQLVSRNLPAHTHVATHYELSGGASGTGTKFPSYGFDNNATPDNDLIAISGGGNGASSGDEFWIVQPFQVTQYIIKT